MIINQNVTAGIYRALSAIFNQAFDATEVFYPRIAMAVPSTTRETSYNWLGAFPKMREWLGDRILKDLKAHNYSITNKDWEATVEVDRNDIEDDSIGIYNPIVSEMGRSARAHPDELIFQTLLAGGFAAECYDGQYFFDTDHPVGAGTASNFGGGAGTTWYLFDTTRAIKPIIFQQRKAPVFTSLDKPDDENVFMRKKFIYGADCRDNAGYGLWQLAYASKDTLNAANYKAARAAMMAYTDDEGKPLGILPRLMIVPPSLEDEARDILLAERLASGATNTYRNTAELLVVPWLS